MDRSTPDPAAAVETMVAQSLEVHTPCGEGRMVWRIWGQGEPVVLLHGGSGSWTHWIRTIPALQDRYTLYVADLPGLGDSDMPPMPYDGDRLVESTDHLAGIVVAGLQDILPPPARYHLVGFSFGSVSGGYVAAKEGDRVKSFTTIGGSALGTAWPGLTGTLRAVEDGMSDAEILDVQRHNLNVIMMATPSASIDDLAAWTQLQNTNRARIRTHTVATSDTLLRALPGVTAPLTAIWGRQDVFLRPGPEDRERALRSVQPSMKMHLVEGAGHWAMYEAADAVNALLLSAFEAADAGRSDLVGASGIRTGIPEEALDKDGEMIFEPRGKSESAPEYLARVAAAGETVTTPCGDGEMVWHVFGDGPPLMLVHGGSGGWTHWIRNIPELAKHFRLLLPDLPGHGDSAMPPEPISGHGLAAIVAAGLDRLLPSGTPCDVAGFSFGGIVSGCVAEQMEDRVRNLVICGSNGLGLPRTQLSGFKHWRGISDPDELAEAHRTNLAILMFADPNNIDDLAIHIQSVNTPKTRIKSRLIAVTDVLGTALPNVKARLSGIWGEHDSYAEAYMDTRRDLFESVQPGCVFHLVKGAGHWSIYEDSDASNAALLDVLGVADR